MILKRESFPSEAVMPPDARTCAVLIAIDSDILPFGSAAAPDPDDDLPATRTTASSEYLLTEEECLIGRDPACQIRVNQRRNDISRKHAIVKHIDAAYILYDKSLLGTYINGQRVSAAHQLSNGDVIGLGYTHEMLHFIDRTQPSTPAILLTEREQQILQRIATGQRVKQIATELMIAPDTVNSHLKKLYDKLKAHNRAEAIMQAHRLRLL
jgi:DNA-binding CsgD family transcriptional regulator